MNWSPARYSRGDLLKALDSVGVRKNDAVYFHFCIQTLGRPEGCDSADETNRFLLDTLQEAVGDEGTIIVPTYTFSFCRRELFDVGATPVAEGPWSTYSEFPEFFRRLPGAIRSMDPIHSVAALGPRADELLRSLPNTCFGSDSVHARLLKIGGKICLLGVGLQEATFQHHVEEMVGVPFRYRKLFTGTIRTPNTERKAGWVMNVHLLAQNGEPDGTALDRLARETGASHVAPVGDGEVVGIGTEQLYALLSETLRKDPWFTAVGPPADPVEIERQRVASPSYAAPLPQHATMNEMIRSLWCLPRDIVSEGYDVALRALATQVPMTIHEYPTGTECWSWLLPEKWTCHEAYLETLAGKRLFSYRDCPLHVVSYSLPYRGIVSRDELFRHLHVHPRIPEAVPFIFKYYERDWGLCCSKVLKDSLREDQYRVVIDTDFSYSTLKVGEVIVPGESKDCIVLCAHLCHPAMVNDDLSGVVVGIDVMRALLQRERPRYNYRFLIVPETIGSIAYLGHNAALIPKMKGGLFLEMLGLENPHALQLSINGDTEIDKCFAQVLHKRDHHARTGAYRTVIGNDERQFNGPGVRVPMLSLSRVLPWSAPDAPYREYHSDHDNFEAVSIKRLEDSRDMVVEMIDAFENNLVPVNHFQGEVFCSRYGLHVDWYKDAEASKAMFDIMDRIDGTLSIVDIAEKCGVSFSAVQNVVKELHRNKLVEYRA